MYSSIGVQPGIELFEEARHKCQVPILNSSLFAHNFVQKLQYMKLHCSCLILSHLVKPEPVSKNAGRFAI